MTRRRRYNLHSSRPDRTGFGAPPNRAANVANSTSARGDNGCGSGAASDLASHLASGGPAWRDQRAPYLQRPRECCGLLAKLLLVSSGLTVPMLKVDPTRDPVRDDPAFQALLADPKNSAPLQAPCE